MKFPIEWAKFNGMTALCLAANEGHYDIVNDLI